MLNLSDIDMNVDYDSLCFLESHLMHDVKRKGKEGFVKEYSAEIDSFRENWTHRDFCFLLALLGYLDSSFSYDESVKLEKYIVDARDFIFVEEDNSLEEVNKTLKSAIPAFLNRGFVYNSVEEAI